MGRGAWTWARLLGSAVVLAVVVHAVGTGPFVAGIRGLGPGTLLVGILIGAVTTLCSAWRWRTVAAALGVGLPLSTATAACYRSQFLNGALPGGVLGDVHRGFWHGADTGDRGRAMRAVFWERTAGQVVQVALAVLVLLVLPSPLHTAMPVLAAALAVAVLAALVTGRHLARHGPARLARVLRAMAGELHEALLSAGTLRAVLLSSLIVCGGLVGVFLLAARAVGVDDGPARLLPLALIVLLAAGLPVNIGGWGPREGAAAWAFTASGSGAAQGTAVATAFGVLVLVATLPGAVVLLVGRLRPRGPAPQPGGGCAAAPPEVVPDSEREHCVPHG